MAAAAAVAVTSVAKFNTHYVCICACVCMRVCIWSVCTTSFFSFWWIVFVFLHLLHLHTQFLRIKSAFQLHDTFTYMCLFIYIFNFLWYHMMIYLFIPSVFACVCVCMRVHMRALFQLTVLYLHSYECKKIFPHIHFDCWVGSIFRCCYCCCCCLLKTKLILQAR